MFRFIVLLALVAIATGCYPENAFRPPPPNFKGWVKSGASDNDVKAQMLACGYQNPYAYDKRKSRNEIAKQQICMFDNGYRSKFSYKGVCFGRTWKEKPACVEYRKTHP